MPSVYLDHMATTPADPRVVDAMLPYFGQRFGNPASRTHAFGWEAAEAVEEARASVASLLGARSAREVVFTSGATEANNLAIRGVVELGPGQPHIVTCATEHKSVLECCRSLERGGCRLTVVPVDGHGIVDLDALAGALGPETVLVSIMVANNETGTLQPLEEIGRITRAHGVVWHADAAQAAGKVALDLGGAEWGPDLLSLSGHKMHGPKGVGALYVRSRRPRVRLRPQVEGGGQERGLRAGTLNVPGIVGLGVACRLCAREMTAERERLEALRDLLLARLEVLGGVQLNGHPTQRLANCLNVSFAGVDGARLITAFRDLAVSAGSACASGESTPSHVLRAMGVGEALASASLRFGLGRWTSVEEVDYAALRVVEEVRRLRGTAAPGPA
ncbi:MAG: cysteine desulfurase family protein [Candidatus Latescibacterota bacterium]